MSNFERNLPLYRPAGNPAFGWIRIPNTPLKGDVVTINGDAYIFGTDFVGNNAAQAIESLVSAIRADQSEGWEVNPNNEAFFRTYSAFWTGQFAVVFCVSPGSAGNAFTLATSTARIQISGATFSGGTDLGSAVGPTPNGGAMTDGGGTLAVANTSQQIFAANAARKYLIVE